MDELKVYFMTFVNPIDNGWLFKNRTEVYKIPFNKETIEQYYEENIFSKKIISQSGTIINGENSSLTGNNQKNFNYDITLVETTKNYIQPLAWGRDLSIAEVFPINHKNIQYSFENWTSKIYEDCMDSYRIGLSDSKESMKEYQKFVSCCGSKDEDITIDGVIYKFGCNFGH